MQTSKTPLIPLALNHLMRLMTLIRRATENASDYSEQQQTGSTDKTEDQKNTLLDQQARRAVKKQQEEQQGQQQEQSTEQSDNANQPIETQTEQPSLKKNESVSDREVRASTPNKTSIRNGKQSLSNGYKKYLMTQAACSAVNLITKVKSMNSKGNI